MSRKVLNVSGIVEDDAEVPRAERPLPHVIEPHPLVGAAACIRRAQETIDVRAIRNLSSLVLGNDGILHAKSQILIAARPLLGIE
jgi:hypothetical protein